MRKLLAVMIVVIFSVITFSLADAMQFSADQIVKSDGHSASSKVYVKDKKFRTEMKGHSQYTIIREDKNIIWMVMPEQKSYMEMQFDPNQRPKVEAKFRGEITRKLIGSETIDGHPTKKYEVTYKEGNRVEKVYVWIATDINFMIKTASIDGRTSSEFKNIKIGSVADSLFEVPAGYQKMSMPSMPGMGGGMIPRQK
jgi:hypothetical protein